LVYRYILASPILLVTTYLKRGVVRVQGPNFEFKTLFHISRMGEATNGEFGN